MSGANIARLATAVSGMSVDDVETSRIAWDEGATALTKVSLALLLAADQVKEGFGDDSQAGAAAKKVLDAMRTEVIGPRLSDMSKAANALGQVRDAMDDARKLDTSMPSTAPGPAPTYSGTTGETHEDITALKIFANKNKAYNQQVAAYGDADEKARQQVEQVNKTYDEAARVMAAIHGEPIDDGSGGGDDPTAPTGGSGGSGGPGVPAVPVRNPTVTPDPTVHPTHPTPIPDPTDEPTPHPQPGLQPAQPTGPTSPIGPTSPVVPTSPIADPGLGTTTGPTQGAVPASGGGSSAAALGAVGAGALGALGAKGALGRLGSAALGRSAGVGAVGTSARSSASGVLGRGGAGAVGGTQAGRSTTTGRGGMASGAGTGQRGTGSRGGAGGRGAGGRGAGAGGAGGRGRGKNDKETSREHEYDVEEDWLDDEGNPTVLS